MEELDKRLSAKPADLVIVDCFSDLYMGSMNESNQVRLFLNQYSQLASKHKCLIIFCITVVSEPRILCHQSIIS